MLDVQVDLVVLHLELAQLRLSFLLDVGEKYAENLRARARLQVTHVVHGESRLPSETHAVCFYHVEGEKLDRLLHDRVARHSTDQLVEVRDSVDRIHMSLLSGLLAGERFALVAVSDHRWDGLEVYRWQFIFRLPLLLET